MPNSITDLSIADILTNLNTNPDSIDCVRELANYLFQELKASNIENAYIVPQYQVLIEAKPESIDANSLFDQHNESSNKSSSNDQYFYFVHRKLNQQDKIPSRSYLAGETRKVVNGVAVFLIVAFQYTVNGTNYLTLTVTQSHPKLTGSDLGRNVVEKVILLKDINLNSPHTAHVQILESLKTSVSILEEIKRHYLDTLSKEALNKQFYGDIVIFYERLLNTQSHVINANNSNNINQKGAVRLLLRVLFVWFLEQKKNVILTSNNLSIQNWLDTKPNNIHSHLEDLFYNALKNPVNISKYWSESRYLNSSLFQKIADMGDDFAKLITDDWFWTSCKISDFDPHKHGIFDLFQKYVFTVAEQNEDEMDYGVDPEMLGRILENLLAEQINPETKESARKSKGAFYTPPAIVNYMCDQTLLQYLNTKLDYNCQNKTELVTQIKLENRNKEAINWLEMIKVLDPACGSGAFPIGFLGQTLKIIMELDKDYDSYKKKKTLIENCIFGADIEPLAVEMTRLRCYLSLMVDATKIEALPNLDFKFVCANSLVGLPEFVESEQNSFGIDSIGEIYASKVSQIKILSTQNYNSHGQNVDNLKVQIQTLCRKIHTDAKANWQTMTANLAKTTDKSQVQMMTKQVDYWSGVEIFWRDIDFFDYSNPKPIFDSELMLKVKDFDVVIGNPPYIQLQTNGGELGNIYQPQKFETFAKSGDIYALFYEQSANLLSQSGISCFITSNKWIRTGYGENLRKFFLTKTRPIALFDLGSDVFESATVDSNILIFGKK